MTPADLARAAALFGVQLPNAVSIYAWRERDVVEFERVSKAPRQVVAHIIRYTKVNMGGGRYVNVYSSRLGPYTAQVID